MVYVDWRNTGTSPVCAVSASIMSDTYGQIARDYYIFAASSLKDCIPPGGVYYEPDSEGHAVTAGAGMSEGMRFGVEIERVKGPELFR